MNKNFSITDRIRSSRFAFNGLKLMFTTQHNIWIHLGISVIVVVTGFLLDIAVNEWLAIIFAIGFVLAAEAFNTAIEFLTDIVSPSYNQKAGLVKDLAAAGVLIAAITSVVIGMVVFIKYI